MPYRWMSEWAHRSHHGPLPDKYDPSSNPLTLMFHQEEGRESTSQRKNAGKGFSKSTCTYTAKVTGESTGTRTSRSTGTGTGAGSNQGTSSGVSSDTDPNTGTSRFADRYTYTGTRVGFDIDISYDAVTGSVVATWKSNQCLLSGESLWGVVVKQASQ